MNLQGSPIMKSYHEAYTGWPNKNGTAYFR